MHVHVHMSMCVCVSISNLCTVCMYKKAINKEMHKVEKEQECFAGF